MCRIGEKGWKGQQGPAGHCKELWEALGQNQMDPYRQTGKVCEVLLATSAVTQVSQQEAWPQDAGGHLRWTKTGGLAPRECTSKPPRAPHDCELASSHCLCMWLQE